MKWNRLLNSERLGVEQDETDVTGRTPFERDADRVICSSAFRRLNRKTQVHPLAPNDHVHTRLTHSIEAAQVGRSLGKAVYDRHRRNFPRGITGADVAAVVQAACLAHDIGNPPFGHGGEAAMVHWFERHPLHSDAVAAAEHRRDLSRLMGTRRASGRSALRKSHLCRWAAVDVCHSRHVPEVPAPA
jgi:predicted deoxyguanosinetriphosphate triphosphohydrolase